MICSRFLVRCALVVAASIVFVACSRPETEVADVVVDATEPISTNSTSLPGAESYIVSPADGATVTSPVTVIFGLKEMGVAPAGVIVENTGHHHLVIDAELPDLTQPLPSDEHHVHFGGGQTQTELTLPPGTHTLQLVFANHVHIPHDPPVYSPQVSITVTPVQ